MSTRYAYVSIRQHTSAYVSIRQHTSSRALYTLPVQPLACNPHPHFQTHINTTFSCSIPSTTPSTHSCAIVDKKEGGGGIVEGTKIKKIEAFASLSTSVGPRQNTSTHSRAMQKEKKGKKNLAREGKKKRGTRQHIDGRRPTSLYQIPSACHPHTAPHTSSSSSR